MQSPRPQHPPSPLHILSPLHQRLNKCLQAACAENTNKCWVMMMEIEKHSHSLSV